MVAIYSCSFITCLLMWILTLSAHHSLRGAKQATCSLLLCQNSHKPPELHSPHCSPWVALLHWYMFTHIQQEIGGVAVWCILQQILCCVFMYGSRCRAVLYFLSSKDHRTNIHNFVSLFLGPKGGDGSHVNIAALSQIVECRILSIMGFTLEHYFMVANLRWSTLQTLFYL